MTTTLEPASSPTLADKIRDQRNLEAQLGSPAERKKIRESAGASISDIAAAVGVTYAAVWQWENRPPKRIRRDHALAYLRELRGLAALTQTQK